MDCGQIGRWLLVGAAISATGCGSKASSVLPPATSTTTLQAHGGARPQSGGVMLSASVTTNVGPSETAQQADAFVDSIGVNTHLYFTGSPYLANYPGVKNALMTLGVRHIRDGAQPAAWGQYASFNDLGANGIKTNFIFDPRGGQVDPVAFAPQVAQALESYEGPNEYDTSGDATWTSTLRAFQTKLYQAVKNNAATAKYPVIGPSLTGSWSTLGDLSSALDYGNMHDYPAGYNPGNTSSWASIAANMANEKFVSASKPVIATETGWGNQNSGPIASQGISVGVMSRYVPRLYLEHFLAGVTRVYQYQLLDYGTDGYGQFGLMTVDASNNFTPKPAYAALAGMIAALKDPGPAFTPSALAYTLGGNVTNVHHLLLQKRDGSFDLVLWQEVDASTNPTPQSVTLTFANAPSTLAVTSFNDSGAGAKTTLATTNASATLAIDDHVTIVQIVPSLATPQPTATPVPTPTPTPTPTATPTPTPTPVVTKPPTPVPTATPVVTAKPIATLAPATPAPSAPTTTSTAPIAWWNVDESTGEWMWDHTGNGNDVELSAGGWNWSTMSPGNTDRSVTYSGNGGFAHIEKAVVDTSKSFTASAWVTLSDLSNWRTAASSEGTHYSAFFLQYSPLTHTFAFTTTTGDWSGLNVDRAAGGPTPTMGTWYHITGVYDANAHTNTLYVNGNLVASVPNTGMWNGYARTLVGRALWVDTQVDFWCGNIDAVTLWPRALAASEVARL